MVERIGRVQADLTDLRRAIYGYPELEQMGMREDMFTRLDTLKRELAETKGVCDGIAQQRREEAAERRGMKRLVGYTGVSSLLTLVTLVVGLLVILNGAGGGP